MNLLAESQMGAVSTSPGFIPSSAGGVGEARKSPGWLLPGESHSLWSELAPHDAHTFQSERRLSFLVSSVMQDTESETRVSRFESSPACKSWVILDE